MKKINKFILSTTLLGILGLVTIPIVVSCSCSSSVTPIYGEVVDNNKIQKASFNDLELNKDQYNFSFKLYADDDLNPKRTFRILKYLNDNNLNYYDGQYDGLTNQSQNICSEKSNVLIIPSKIMYDNEWYYFNGFSEYGSSDKFWEYLQLNKVLNSKLKSIRLDPAIKHIPRAQINMYLTDNLVDIQNVPLSPFKPDNLEQYPILYKINSKNKNNKVFSNITWNTYTDPNYLYSLPEIRGDSQTKLSLKNFYIPKEVSRIYGISGIKYNGFTFSDNIKYLEGYAFNETFNASFIPRRFYEQDIKEGLFSNMTIDIDIPTGIKTIGDNSFESCNFLNPVVKIPEGVNSIGWEAFDKTNIQTYYLPDSLTSLGKYDNNEPYYPFNYFKDDYGNKTYPNFVVKSQRVKDLLIKAAQANFLENFATKATITIDPNWDQKI